MTSSAASETESARKRVLGRLVGGTADHLHAAAVGHVDVEQDDVGLGSAIDARTASADVAGSPTISTWPSSSARTPARKSSWSSTITTRGHAAPGMVELDLGARRRAPSGWRRGRRGAPCARRSTRARRGGPAGRRPGRSPGRGRGRRPASALVGRLGVDVDRRAAAELRRVDHRLARGGHERLAALVERRVADDDDLDRHAVGALDLAGHRLQRGGEPVVVALRGRRQPRAQLALLAAGQRGHLARVVGALLHERERLQHRVVEVRGHLGALLRADALRALGGQRAHEPERPRREDDPEHDGHHEHGEDDVARGGQRVVGGEEDDAGGDHQRRADAVAREDLGALAAFLLGRRRQLGRRRRPWGAATGARAARRPRPAAPPARRWRRRTRSRAPRMVSRKASGHEAHPDGDLDRAAAARQAPRPRGRAAVGHAVVDGHEHPREA